MKSLPIAPAQRERILKIACDGTTAKQIAERFGTTYGRVRHLIDRAEKAGDVPAGTLARCGAAPTKLHQPEVEETRKIRAYAPQRKVASEMGRCSVCSSPTEVAVDIEQSNATLKFRLCGVDARELRDAIDLALGEAVSKRAAFNGRFRS